MSPDGQRVAWTSQFVDRTDVFTSNIDGSDIRNLTEGIDSGAWNPDWSPDGSHIAFDAGSHVWIMRADGSDARALTTGSAPRWSPDGTKLSFVRYGSFPHRLTQLWTVNADGTDAVNVAGCVSYYAWTPDSREIIGVGQWYTSCSKYFVVAADGSGARSLEIDLLSSMYGMDISSDFAFSPDGRQVAFVGRDADGGRLFLADSDFTNLRALTEIQPYREYEGAFPPAWSPDGQWLAFAREVNGSKEIFVTSVAGSGPPRQVTSSPLTDDMSPSWWR
jgi:Tol biopolymer transport system component